MVSLFQYKDMVYQIIGAAMAVHSELGYGLLEPVYQECMQLELKLRSIDSISEQKISIYYKNQMLEKKYNMDLVVGDVVVEMKSVSELITAHRAQLCNYLRLTQKPIGILLNFGEESLVGERLAYDKETNRCYVVDRNMQPVPKDEYLADY